MVKCVSPTNIKKPPIEISATWVARQCLERILD